MQTKHIQSVSSFQPLLGAFLTIIIEWADMMKSWDLESQPCGSPLTLILWRYVVAPHSTSLKKSLQADKSSFSDAYVCVFVLYQSTRGPKDDKWVLSGRRQS